jgi:hypothetical protein
MTTSQKSRIVVIILTCFANLRGEEPKAYAPETTESSEIFRTKVLKVHHFTEADFEYLAYTIDWRGHEVIVVPFSADEILKEGDAIRCTMRAMPVKVGEGKKATITFSVLPSRTSASNAARLQTVADEVNRRRANRNAEEPPVAK